MATELPRAALRLGSLIRSVYIVALLSKPCGNKRLKQTHPSAALAQRVRVAVTSCNPGLRSHRALPHQQRKSNDARLRPFRCNRNWHRYPRLHRDNCRPRTRLLVPVVTDVLFHAKIRILHMPSPPKEAVLEPRQRVSTTGGLRSV